MTSLITPKIAFESFFSQINHRSKYLFFSIPFVFFRVLNNISRTKKNSFSSKNFCCSMFFCEPYNEGKLKIAIDTGLLDLENDLSFELQFSFPSFRPIWAIFMGNTIRLKNLYFCALHLELECREMSKNAIPTNTKRFSNQFFFTTQDLIYFVKLSFDSIIFVKTCENNNPIVPPLHQILD